MIHMLINRITQYWEISIIFKLIYGFNMNSVKTPVGILQWKLIIILKSVCKVKWPNREDSRKTKNEYLLYYT